MCVSSDEPSRRNDGDDAQISLYLNHNCLALSGSFPSGPLYMECSGILHQQRLLGAPHQLIRRAKFLYELFFPDFTEACNLGNERNRQTAEEDQDEMLSNCKHTPFRDMEFLYITVSLMNLEISSSEQSLMAYPKCFMMGDFQDQPTCTMQLCSNPRHRMSWPGYLRPLFLWKPGISRE